MTDEEFLNCCNERASTEDCSFTTKQIVRLLKLAMRPANMISFWESMPDHLIKCGPSDIKELVKQARDRI